MQKLKSLTIAEIIESLKRRGALTLLGATEKEEGRRKQEALSLGFNRESKEVITYKEAAYVARVLSSKRHVVHLKNIWSTLGDT